MVIRTIEGLEWRVESPSEYWLLHQICDLPISIVMVECRVWLICQGDEPCPGTWSSLKEAVSAFVSAFKIGIAEGFIEWDQL